MTSKIRKHFLILLTILAIDHIGFGFVFVLFAPLILEPQYQMFDATTPLYIKNYLLALLFMIYPAAQLLSAPLFGDLADKRGDMKILFYTLMGSAWSIFLSGLAVFFRSYKFLLLGRLVTGLFAGNMSVCMANIARLSSNEKERSKNLGWLVVVQGACWPIAMVVGGILSDPSKSVWFSPTLPFAIVFVLTLATSVFLYFYQQSAPDIQSTKEPPKKIPFSIKDTIIDVLSALSRGPTRPFFLFILFWNIGWGLSVQWFGAHSLTYYRSSQMLVSLNLIIQGLAWALGGATLNPWMLKRFDSSQIASITLLATGSFLLACFFSFNSYILFCTALAFATYTSSVADANLTTLLSMHADEKSQGKIMGLTSSIMSLAGVLIPILGGLFGMYSLHLCYLFASSVFLTAGYSVAQNRKNG